MKKSFWENLVMVAILIVLLQTMADDILTLTDGSWKLRSLLLYVGFFLDIFFTVEFLVRLYLAYVEGNTKDYLIRNYGWIDLIASVPLLLFSSGPVVYGLLAGGVPVFGFGRSLNLLKTVKIVRVARILRVLRMLKVVKHLKQAESVMAQRHVGKITASVLSVTILLSSGALFLVSSLSAQSFETAYWQSLEGATKILDAQDSPHFPEEVRKTSNLVPYLLQVRLDGREIYSRHDPAYLAEKFGPYDYVYEKQGSVELFFDYRLVNRHQAEQSLSIFVLVVGLLLTLLLYYAPHFALTITDPIFVMLKGFKDASYNLEVKILPQYRDDEVYQLAEGYNEEYLPLKQRNQELGKEEKSALQWEAVSELFKKG